MLNFELWKVLIRWIKTTVKPSAIRPPKPVYANPRVGIGLKILTDIDLPNLNNLLILIELAQLAKIAEREKIQF